VLMPGDEAGDIERFRAGVKPVRVRE
jgi:hypothetical protein